MIITVPTSVQSDICITSQSNCATVNYTVSDLNTIIMISQQSYSCTSVTYTIVVRDQCSDTEVTIDSGSMTDYNIPYTMNCTNITIIVENSLGRSPNHSVNTSSPGESISNRKN